jgi:AP-3 complex subunit delta-1
MRIVQGTKAISLMYECIKTLITGGMIAPHTSPESTSETNMMLVAACSEKLKGMIESDDMNCLLFLTSEVPRTDDHVAASRVAA